MGLNPNPSWARVSPTLIPFSSLLPVLNTLVACSSAARPWCAPATSAAGAAAEVSSLPSPPPHPGDLPLVVQCDLAHPQLRLGFPRWQRGPAVLPGIPNSLGVHLRHVVVMWGGTSSPLALSRGHTGTAPSPAILRPWAQVWFFSLPSLLPLGLRAML